MIWKNSVWKELILFKKNGEILLGRASRQKIKEIYK